MTCKIRIENKQSYDIHVKYLKLKSGDIKIVTFKIEAIDDIPGDYDIPEWLTEDLIKEEINNNELWM